jgi:hypothetical protein
MSQSVLLGLRYALNPPAPVAAPVLAAAPPATVAAPQNLARSYLLFFDWDSAELSTRANQIILDAAQNAGRVRYTKIDVQGHVAWELIDRSSSIPKLEVETPGLASPTPQARALAMISISSRSRAFSLSFLESFSPLGMALGSRMTAAAVTGPAQGPRPASSTPQTGWGLCASSDQSGPPRRMLSA